MSRRLLIRRILKWAGVGVCVVMMIGWVFTGYWRISFFADHWVVSTEFGAISLYRRLPSRSSWYLQVRGWQTGPIHQRWRHFILFELRLPNRVLIWNRGRPFAEKTYIPFWLPLMPISLFTLGLFWLDRRRIPPGHCQECGYNLTGNVSGVCPECGAKIAD